MLQGVISDGYEIKLVKIRESDFAAFVTDQKADHGAQKLRVGVRGKGGPL